MADWYEFFLSLTFTQIHTHAFLIILFSQEFFKSTILISFIILILLLLFYFRKFMIPIPVKQM